MKKIPSSHFKSSEHAKLELLIERKINQLLAKKLLAMNSDYKKLYLQMSKNNFNRAFKDLNLFNQNNSFTPPSFKLNNTQLLNHFSKMLMHGIFKNM